MNAISANDTGLPGGALDRLALFAEWTKTTPPERILVDDGDGRTFSDDILIYAARNGMSLDWFWLGNEMGLVMEAFHRAREAIAADDEWIAAIEALDETEKLVILLGAKAVASKAMPIGQFEAWARNLIDRHRAGEALRVSDLDLPSQPAPGCQ